jgi:hypothetical protein
VLAGAVARERFEPIPRWSAQEVERLRGIQLRELTRATFTIEPILHGHDLDPRSSELGARVPDDLPETSRARR